MQSGSILSLTNTSVATVGASGFRVVVFRIPFSRLSSFSCLQHVACLQPAVSAGKCFFFLFIYNMLHYNVILHVSGKVCVSLANIPCSILSVALAAIFDFSLHFVRL
jgi:hypothetical protein